MKSLLKKKTFIIPVIVMGIFLTSGGVLFGIYQKETKKEIEQVKALSKKQEESFKAFEEIVEYGTSWSYEEMVSKFLTQENLEENTNIEIKIEEETLERNDSYSFLEVGEKRIEVTLRTSYTYQNSKIKEIQNKKEYTLSIEDTKFPIIEGVKNHEIYVGDSLSLKEGIRAYDEVDGELDASIDGEVDTKKVGETEIKVRAIDKNGNVTEQTFKVVVKEKTVTKSTTTSKKPSSSNTSTNNTTVSNDASTKAGRLNLAKAEAKKVIASIIKPGMSDKEKAYAIFVYLHTNVERQTNQSTEAYKTNFGNEAYAALVMKIAACSGFCKAVTILCDLAGLQSQHINAGAWTHQWNKVLINGEWIILDAQGGIFGGITHPLE